MNLHLKRTGDPKRFSEKAKRGILRTSKRKIQAGFFENARYQDGEYVAAVAIQNEHGIPNRQPARPFMKNALTKMRKPLRNALGRRLNGEDLTLSERDAERIGMIMQSEIQKSIDSGPWKANSPMTIARKGSSKPLIDTGFMRQSVTFKVTKG